MQGLAEDRTASSADAEASCAQVHTRLSVPVWRVGSLNYSQLDTDSFRGEHPFTVAIPLGLRP